MIRKLILAVGATVVLGAAALSPTAASAWGHGHWGGHHGWYGHGFGYYGPTYIASPDCYLVRRQVQFADGSWHWRRFRVCN